MPYKSIEAKREYQRRWMAQRREDWFRENGPCVECGSWEDLELDHIDRTTKVDHKVWSWAEARRLEELAKCQALCADCHLAKSFEERPIKRSHGTESMYNRFGCRCAPCRAAKSKANRRFRSKV